MQPVPTVPGVLHRQGIDPTLDRMLLDGIQGNILRGHGRDHVRMILFSFGSLLPADCHAVMVKIRQYVTSAWEQEEQRREYRKNQTDRLFGGLLLTATGYSRLGLAKVSECLSTPPLLSPSEDARLFGLGMKSANSASRLGDSPDDWDYFYKVNVDGLLLLARDHEDRLNRDQTEATRQIQVLGGTVIGMESGTALRDPSRGDAAIEHFGYLDGISQPLYMADSIQSAATHGRGPWDASAPLSNVLLPDPGVQAGEGFGSFMVFRKLEQNVMAFNEAVEGIADQLSLEGEQRARAGALLIGRFKDGTSIALQPMPGQPLPANDFNYTEDPDGQRCPFFAHARRTGPRSTKPKSTTSTGRQRITRRGITYGNRAPNMRDEPQFGVGLLFMGFVSSLEQFTTVQADWASSPQFIPGSGIDPVIGLPYPSAEYKFPANWGSPDHVAVSWKSLPGDKQIISVKGGEYFFAPSIPFLKSLG